MARSVADCAAMLAAMAGPDPGDPATLAQPAAADYPALLAAGVALDVNVILPPPCISISGSPYKIHGSVGMALPSTPRRAALLARGLACCGASSISRCGWASSAAAAPSTSWGRTSPGC